MPIPDSVKNLPGWPVEPPFVPAQRSDSPAAWARDAQEAARYGQQPQQVVVNHYHAAQRRGPDFGQVLGWVALGGIVVSALLATAMVAVALAILAVILRGLWKDMQGGK